MTGAAGVVTGLLAAASVLVLWPPAGALSRTRRLRAGGGRRRGAEPHLGADRRRRTDPSSRQGRRVAAGLAGAGVSLVGTDLVGTSTALVAGVVLAVGLDRWLGSLDTVAARRRAAELAAELPTTADLLAACLAAGATLEQALEVTAEGVGGAVAEALRPVLATLRLGGPPALCWRDLDDPALAPLARTLARAMSSGAPAAAVVARLADEQRVTRRAAAEAEARRVGVRAMAPLGVCFLPAFVLLGVVPVVAGMASLVLPALL